MLPGDLIELLRPFFRADEDEELLLDPTPACAHATYWPLSVTACHLGGWRGALGTKAYSWLPTSAGAAFHACLASAGQIQAAQQSHGELTNAAARVNNPIVQLVTAYEALPVRR